VAALSFAGKLHRLCLALELVGAGMPIGTKDRERYLDPMLGPGWEAVARAIVQRGVAPAGLEAVFEEVAGGAGRVSEAVLAALHDEACFSAVAWVVFATASSMVRAGSVLWTPKAWGLSETDRVVADRLNETASRYISERRRPAGLRLALGDAACEAGVCEPDAALAARMGVLASAYRCAWLREAVEAALAECGAKRSLPDFGDSLFARNLRGEIQFVAKTRVARTSDGIERARRRARLEERVQFYADREFDLRGLGEEERCRLAAKGVFWRDGKLRLLVERRFLLEAAANVAQPSAQAPAMVRFLCENRTAIDMPAGERLEDLAEQQSSETWVVFNCEALMARARKRDPESDASAARDLDAALFEARRTMLRLDPLDAAADLVAVPA